MLDCGINELPKLLEQNEISEKEFLNELAVYIMKNKKLFGLNKYDDDFNSEVIVKLLEGNTSFLNNFQNDKDNFIPYLYSYVKSLIHGVTKMCISHNSKDEYFNNETIAEFPQHHNEYEIPGKENKKTAYIHSTSKKEKREYNIENMLRTDVQDKMLLVLALKSAYYLCDEDISKVCKMYNLKEEDFYNAIELCKQDLEFKIKKRQSIIERRNKAYYFHKTCENQLERLEELDFMNEPEQLKLDLERKNLKHLTCWKKINSKLSQGYLMIRPSSKMVADLLGICVRQVDYYLHVSKRKN